MPDSGIAALTPVTGLNVTLTDRVLSVRINRPSSLNSLTVPILTGIADTLERAAADPVVKVVRLGGVGRGFSSGVSMSVDDVWGGGPPTAGRRRGQPRSTRRGRATAPGCSCRSRTSGRRRCLASAGV